MTLYTVMPEEQVFAGMDETPEPTQEVRIAGVVMEVQPVSRRRAKIVRLISPNPYDYLNPAYMPGELIDY